MRRAAGHLAPPRRRFRFVVGVALVLAGTGLLGYVGWQLYGSNVVARQAHQRLVEQLDERWSDGSADPTDERSPSAGEATALLRVPRFGEDYVLPVLEGVEPAQLASGYGHFPGTAAPGEPGNFAVAAHRVTHGEPLRRMPELRPGDEVVVETAEAVHTYVLDTDPNDLVVTFEEDWVVDRLPDNPEPGGVEPPSREPGSRLITLTTCAELFHTDDRMVAFGHLVESRPKPPR